jgi:carbon-monoxide dehydrogenase medium subunit
VLHVDDLIGLGSEEIAFSCRLALLRPYLLVPTAWIDDVLCAGRQDIDRLFGTIARSVWKFAGEAGGDCRERQREAASMANSIVSGPSGDLYVATNLSDALEALAERGADGVPVAGATWIMRAGLRGEPRSRAYVAISGIPELSEIDVTDREIRIGACVTHAVLARVLAGIPGCRALSEAAAQSANPAVREMATVGGNLAARDFAAADLPPALTALGARVDVASASGTQRLSMEDFLRWRENGRVGALVSQVVVPRTAWLSSHVRLPLRKAGDYPVAIVSMAVERDGHRIAEARVSVGSVERTSRRWESLERMLRGATLDPDAIAQQAKDLVDDFDARDGVEAAGWYRKQVLPVLVARALKAIS